MLSPHSPISLCVRIVVAYINNCRCLFRTFGLLPTGMLFTTIKPINNMLVYINPNVEDVRVMKNKTLQFLKSKASQYYPRLASRVNEEIRLKKMLDEYHSVECKSSQAPATKTPPQAIQGMWQAYGSMHAAKTRGWFGIAATGVIGTGLFLYRLILSDQKKEIKLKQQENKTLEEKNKISEIQLKEKEENLQDREKILETEHALTEKIVKEGLELSNSYMIISNQLECAEQYITKLCGIDEVCKSEYVKLKNSTTPLIIIDNNVENESLSLRK